MRCLFLLTILFLYSCINREKQQTIVNQKDRNINGLIADTTNEKKLVL